jgi:hypothetical protein
VYRRLDCWHNPQPDQSGDAVFTGAVVDPTKLLLTYLVPYCVSTYGAVSYRLHVAQPAANEPARALVR